MDGEFKVRELAKVVGTKWSKPGMKPALLKLYTRKIDAARKCWEGLHLPPAASKPAVSEAEILMLFGVMEQPKPNRAKLTAITALKAAASSASSGSTCSTAIIDDSRSKLSASTVTNHSSITTGAISSLNTAFFRPTEPSLIEKAPEEVIDDLLELEDPAVVVAEFMAASRPQSSEPINPPIQAWSGPESASNREGRPRLQNFDSRQSSPSPASPGYPGAPSITKRWADFSSDSDSEFEQVLDEFDNLGAS